MSRLALVLVPFVVISCLTAAEPDTARGDRIRNAYFRSQVKRIADSALADVKTLDDWQRQRPRMRERFLDMLGLWPLPPRTDLHATITGKVDTEHFTVEKLHFQSSPALYVTANLYLPKKAKLPAPAILYLCGHARVVIDKVAYGNKTFYQHHAAWFAEHGYVCLVLDTLQLGEVPGEHHGTYQQGQWWWQSLGYTPAGVECWNAMRAIDYLQSRPEVDPKRIGVSGRSGGGASSWWIAAADERIACAVPVAGIADLWAHVAEGDTARFKDGVVSGHCDCMYFVNTYRWDFAQVMALIAPRPLMLGNSDADAIFPVAGYRVLADKVRRLYDLYGAGDRFVVLETQGPHKDTPELRLGEYRWMNRWLKNEPGDVIERERPRMTPQKLKVFDRLPADAINPLVPEGWLRPAVIDQPRVPEVAREWWKGKGPELMQELRERVFGGWPQPPPPLNVKPAADVRHDGLRLRAWDFQSEEEVPLRLWLLTAEKTDKPTLVVLNVLDEAGWSEWAGDLGPAFKDALQLSTPPRLDAAHFTQNQRVLEKQKWAFAAVAPRGVGPTRWSEASPFDGKPAGQHLRRKFALLGQTLDGQRTWDVRRAQACLRSVPDLAGVPLWLQGKKEMAGIALYAALFEPDVKRLDLWHPPASHRQGPTLLGVLRVLDMPQAMALAFPRKIKLYVKDDAEARAWEWPLELQKALGQDHLQVRKVPE